MIAMKTGEKLVTVILLVAILLGFSLSSLKVGFAATLGEIDLYTQKEPYSGKGPNVMSDAFGPDEEVLIFALVTYGDSAVANRLVSFEAVGPENSIENISFVRSAFTDGNGIANVSFRMPSADATSFGQWVVVGNVKIGDVTYTDTVPFRAGWIVQVVSVRTVDGNYAYQDKFLRKGYVGIELVVKNIAMTDRNATLTIAVYDSVGVRINATEIDNFLVLANETLVYYYYFMYIPENAFLGNATINAAAFTGPVSLGGVPYCPEVSTIFLITNRNVGILDIQPSSRLVYVGEAVMIDVVVLNKGEQAESFNVSAYYNGTLIGVATVIGLNPHTNATSQFVWNTQGLAQGTYFISATAGPVPTEVDLSDNNVTDGSVKVVLSPEGLTIPDWFYWILLILSLIFLLIALLAWFIRRRRKMSSSFYSGWTAWYYGHNLPSKTRKRR